jgi:thymidylate kinase
MIDGIDGSGKSTVISAWKKYLSDQGNAIFDLKNYFQTNDRYPELHEIKSYDFIFSAEPTFTGIGKVLREELINQKNHYSALAIAQAFSLDRLILYNKIIIPSLSQEKCIIQDRGVSSALAYQAIQEDGPSLNDLAEMVGNKLALQNCPNHLVIVKVSEDTALSRLSGRTDKQDEAIFEKQNFIKKLIDQYELPEFQNIFTRCGTQIHYLSGEEKIDIMKAEAIKLLQNILKK